MQACRLAPLILMTSVVHDIDRTIVLVGLMGCGKTCIGRRLARRLQLSFADADDEIVNAAGLAVPEIFATLGESAFRDGERRVFGREHLDPPRQPRGH